MDKKDEPKPKEKVNLRFPKVGFKGTGTYTPPPITEVKKEN